MIPNKPLVSIIIPTCNRPEYLIRSIKSVISQTFSFWECIIIDDCSKVSAKKVLKEFLELDKRFKIIRNSTPKFASEARNIGIRSSQGFYIAFLDDDDYWHSEKLQKQINFMQRNKYKVSYCWAYILKKNDEITVREPYLEGNIFDLMLAGQPLCNCSTLIAEKKVIEDIGGFNKLLRRGNDGDLIRRLSQFHHIGLLKEKLVYYQVETKGLNISTNNKIGIKRSLKSYRYRLNFFNKEIKNRPFIKALIYLEISNCYAKIGFSKIATKYFLTSIKIIIPEIYIFLNKIIRNILLILFIPLKKFIFFFLKYTKLHKKNYWP